MITVVLVALALVWVLAPLPTDGLPSLSAAVSASVARNGSSLGEIVRVTPTLVFLTSDGNGAIVPERVGGALKPVPPGAVPDAVLIEAVGSIDFGFARVIGVESGSARRSLTPSRWLAWQSARTLLAWTQASPSCSMRCSDDSWGRRSTSALPATRVWLPARSRCSN
jgi:hypothetical protein